MSSPLPSRFAQMLPSDGPLPELADKLALYGRLVGDWEMDVVEHGRDGAIRRGRGSIHFGWVLNGRAIQDIWRIPGVGQESAGEVAPMYGTTLRVYDPKLDAWRILWSDPVMQYYTHQIGRAVGDDIVQEGEDARGTPTRWSFKDITPNSFHWTAEYKPKGAADWHLGVEYFARRVSG